MTNDNVIMAHCWFIIRPQRWSIFNNLKYWKISIAYKYYMVRGETGQSIFPEVGP